VRILVLVNVYPPHHAGTFDFRCQAMVENLKKRGHQVLVLTSKYGLQNEQRDHEIERRLVLNGIFDIPLVTRYGSVKQIEIRNNAVMRETLAEYQPEVVYVWSLHGVSKSLIFTLRNSKIPTVYDVGDDWLSRGIRTDPWLRWWNRPEAPMGAKLQRGWLEFTGGRTKLNRIAPTQLTKGYDRVKELYGPVAALEHVQPNSIGAFPFPRLYFCSAALKEEVERAGFRVAHGDVIYPGIPTDKFVAEIKPPSAPVLKFLIVTQLTPLSGVMTALEALRLARENKVKATVSIYGKGESEQTAQVRSFVIQHQLPVEFLAVSSTHQELPKIYRQHDAYIYTAEWEEPFALAPLEAMASGLPVIAAKAGGARELLRHGENGLTFTPGDALELSSRMLELQLQPNLRVQMAENAQQEVMMRFNESYVLDQTENFLAQTIEMWPGLI
jgi:glycogen synthase